MEWNGYSCESWDFMGRTAALVKPRKTAEGSPWAIYTEYFGAFPDTAMELLDRGWHLARLENQDRWGSREDQDMRHAFLLYLREKYGLAAKCVPIGMSCGGLHAVKYAALYPEDVAVLYLDAPVLNLLSCPMGFGSGIADDGMIRECLEALRLTRAEMLSYRDHPLDVMGVLAEHRIPVILVYGKADDVVPYEENGLLLEKMYREAGAPIQVIGKDGCGHHPHGLKDPGITADYIERQWRTV